MWFKGTRCSKLRAHLLRRASVAQEVYRGREWQRQPLALRLRRRRDSAGALQIRVLGPSWPPRETTRAPHSYQVWAFHRLHSVHVSLEPLWHPNDIVACSRAKGKLEETHLVAYRLRAYVFWRHLYRCVVETGCVVHTPNRACHLNDWTGQATRL